MLAGPGKGHVLVQHPPPPSRRYHAISRPMGGLGCGRHPPPRGRPLALHRRPAAPAGAMEPVQPGWSMTRTLSREDVAVSEWKAVSCLRAQVIAASSATRGKVRRLSSWQSYHFPLRLQRRLRRRGHRVLTDAWSVFNPRASPWAGVPGRRCAPCRRERFASFATRGARVLTLFCVKMSQLCMFKDQ